MMINSLSWDFFDEEGHLVKWETILKAMAGEQEWAFRDEILFIKPALIPAIEPTHRNVFLWCQFP
jgi:hypothetical protein